MGRGLLLKSKRELLDEYGGPITLTKEWAKSVLRRMGFTKRIANSPLESVLYTLVSSIIHTSVMQINISTSMSFTSILIIYWPYAELHLHHIKCRLDITVYTRRAPAMGGKRSIAAK